MNRMAQFAASGVLLVSAVSAVAQTHELKLSPDNVHWGDFDASVKPVLRVASGETVRVETMLTAPEMLRMVGVSDAEIPNSVTAVVNSKPFASAGNALTGPIYVEGAKPGDMLEIRILEFEFLHPFGWTQFRPDKGTLPEEFPYFRGKLIRFDPEKGTAEFSPGITLKLAPFWGTIGVAPPARVGPVASGVPGFNGGNFDNKELVAVSKLFFTRPCAWRLALDAGRSRPAGRWGSQRRRRRDIAARHDSDRCSYWEGRSDGRVRKPQLISFRWACIPIWMKPLEWLPMK